MALKRLLPLLPALLAVILILPALAGGGTRRPCPACPRQRPPRPAATSPRNGPVVWPGDVTIDNAPEFVGATGTDGRVRLADRQVIGGPWATATGHVLRDNPFGVVDVVGGRNRFLVKLAKDLRVLRAGPCTGDRAQAVFRPAITDPTPDFVSWEE